MSVFGTVDLDSGVSGSCCTVWNVAEKSRQVPWSHLWDFLLIWIKLGSD